MKKTIVFFILLNILGAFLLKETLEDNAFNKGLAAGYVVGFNDGEFRGIYTCPCWER